MGEIIDIIDRMIEIVLVGGLEMRYRGVPIEKFFVGIFFGYLHYYMAFCLLTTSLYYLIGKLRKKKA